MTGGERRARLLALLLPLALIAGALGSQYIGNLYPCEMCHWQRWPHYLAIVAATMAFVIPGRQAREGLVFTAAILIAVSGAIGVFHAGVEYHWWEGITACTATTTLDPSMNPADRLAAIMRAPMVRCDQAQWRFLGISLAGYNALLSLGGAVLILAMMRKGSTRMRR